MKSDSSGGFYRSIGSMDGSQRNKLTRPPPSSNSRSRPRTKKREDTFDRNSRDPADPDHAQEKQALVQRVGFELVDELLYHYAANHTQIQLLNESPSTDGVYLCEANDLAAENTRAAAGSAALISAAAALEAQEKLRDAAAAVVELLAPRDSQATMKRASTKAKQLFFLMMAAPPADHGVDTRRHGKNCKLPGKKQRAAWLTRQAARPGGAKAALHDGTAGLKRPRPGSGTPTPTQKPSRQASEQTHLQEEQEQQQHLEHWQKEQPDKSVSGKSTGKENKETSNRGSSGGGGRRVTGGNKRTAKKTKDAHLHPHPPTSQPARPVLSASAMLDILGGATHDDSRRKQDPRSKLPSPVLPQGLKNAGGKLHAGGKLQPKPARSQRKPSAASKYLDLALS
jgi:hypothetical protein